MRDARRKGRQTGIEMTGVEMGIWTDRASSFPHIPEGSSRATESFGDTPGEFWGQDPTGIAI